MIDNKNASPAPQEVKHLRQYDGFDGEICVQPRGAGATTYESAKRREEENGESPSENAAKVNFLPITTSIVSYGNDDF